MRCQGIKTQLSVCKKTSVLPAVLPLCSFLPTFGLINTHSPQMIFQLRKKKRDDARGLPNVAQKAGLCSGYPGCRRGLAMRMLERVVVQGGWLGRSCTVCSLSGIIPKLSEGFLAPLPGWEPSLSAFWETVPVSLIPVLGSSSRIHGASVIPDWRIWGQEAQFLGSGQEMLLVPGVECPRGLGGLRLGKRLHLLHF